ACGFGAYRYFREVSHVLPANWKLFIDTFLEGYHIFALHRTTLHPVFHSYPGFLRTFGPHINTGALRTSVGELKDRPETEWSLRANASVIYVIGP
ncbi:SRPBCC family protein, partial [Salmonella enterica]